VPHSDIRVAEDMSETDESVGHETFVKGGEDRWGNIDEPVQNRPSKDESAPCFMKK
jgi:hypothetical protein